jgi:tight adherence protein B
MKALALGLLAGLITFPVASYAASLRRRAWLRGRLAPHLEPAAEQEDSGTRARLRARADALLQGTERRLSGSRAWRAVERRAERADLPLRTVELAYAVAGCGLALGVAGALVTGSPVPFLLAPPFSVAVALVVLSALAARRGRAFEEQLPELLDAVAASLRAGHGLNSALQAVAQDADEPAAKELRRALSETRLGRALEDALADVAERVDCEDLRFVLAAISIQREVGGSVAGLFETVNETVRDRRRLERKLRSLTATGRASAWVLVALPIVVGLALTLVNRGYMHPLYASGVGRMLLAGSVLSMACGGLALRRIVAPRG